ncbi:unnamed protein product [Thelazia callipaeda]|uniref:ShKT domain-containing protein n=1 Tax=Thelazia callipaeda TaxID=103827 RepID=A0A0N5CSY4_THECL|nr:unnamed protein product [Thelazia callipaeda]
MFKLVRTILCDCVDRAPPNKPSSCPALKHLCKDPLYEQLMSTECPKTCGKCPTPTHQISDFIKLGTQ